MNLQRAGVVTVGVVLGAGAFFASSHYWSERRSTAPKVSFDRDIRPILNQNCISCHGGVKQAGGVSFIYREEALGQAKSGRAIIVPGNPNASEFMARVTSNDAEVRMPLHAPPLSETQVELLSQWIEQGAQWEDYWAFVAPEPQRVPQVRDAHWARGPIDRFVLSRLEQEKLIPAAEADKTALLRRVTFDLTGLPPTAEELSAFLADSAIDAYEKAVDRLLSSPHYGERWASMWLDLARYADTRGYDLDFVRPGVWPYRDWVIDAFNRNIPYDKFVIAQLAGDLLPNPSFEDLVATSFQRQAPANDECGTDDEEYRLMAVLDRAATTWSVLNGVTINCVQCHSHPYDPIRHKEYYQFLAFYNTSRDADLPFDDAPILRVPKDYSRRSEVAHLVQEGTRLRRGLVEQGKILEARASWRALPIETAFVDEALALERYVTELKVARLEGSNPFAKLRPEVDPAPRVPAEALRRQLQMTIAQTASELDRARKQGTPALHTRNGELQHLGTIPVRSVYELSTAPASEEITALRIEVPAVDARKARHSPEDGFIVDRIDGWVQASDGAERQIRFRYFVADSEENLASAIRSHLTSPLKAEPVSDGIDVFAANSKLFRTRWVIGIPVSPLPAGNRIRLHLSHSKEMGGRPATVRRLRLSVSADSRWSKWQEQSRIDEKLAQLVDIQRQLAAIPAVPLPVMVEQPTDEQRQTLQFDRGNFLTKVGPALSPGVPAIFAKLSTGRPANRLMMAQWFFEPGQPLTARVAVNRYWEQLFGTGIVETQEDFGSAGEKPSHPELLDWLALHFERDLQWDMKALLRELVTSATYRQSSRASPALREKDPRNRLLARGPQQRLTAEMVRDQALLASGLLTRTFGGPPVLPPQPASVSMDFSFMNIGMKWIDATGPDRYRRAIYTFLKRTSIYPSLVIFDASSRSVSLARRIPTNTPLQALVTLNDPAYHEAAHSLARLMIAESMGDLSRAAIVDRGMVYGARRVLSRDPTVRELQLLRDLYEKRVASGEGQLPAWTAVASVLLNLDAALTR